MSIHIAEDKIADIKNAADILDIISDYVVLKKTGKNYVGLCPFHSEKTPSFTVNSEKQIFHCFGCGEGGNVFTFLMKKDGLSFPDTVRLVGKRYGIEIAEKGHGQKHRTFDEKEILFTINRQAMEFYRENLRNSKTGKTALAYLNQRGITDEIIETFQLGYAPEGWSLLLSYLSKKEISQKFLEKTGLIVSRKNGTGYYDRFRNRIVFPIIDIQQRVIGFGGRVMDDALPKYLNTPETPVFQKGRSLYGLNRAKEKCRDTETVYIAEGYFDLLALHQHGIENAVATLGTSLTAEHVRMLRNRYVGKNGTVVLVYDSDAAGIKAAKRSIDIFKQGYVDAKILVLPEGFDPDSYLFKYGREPFLKKAGNALSALSFLIESSIRQYGLSIEGKNRIVSDMTGHLVQVNDDIARSLYVKELGERLGIDESAIHRKIDEIRTAATKNKRRHPGTNDGDAVDDGKNRPSVAEYGSARLSRLERHVVAMMLHYPNILEEIYNRDMIRYFQDGSLKSIAQTIIDKRHHYTGRVSEIVDAIDNTEYRNVVTSLAMSEEGWNREGCLKLIHQFESSRNRHQDDLLRRIKAAEDSHDDQLLLELLKEKQTKANRFKNDLDCSGGKNK